MDKKLIIPDRRDMYLAIGMVLCGFFFWECGLISYGSSIGKAVFTIVICGVSGSYLCANGLRQSKRSLISLALMAVLGISFILFSGRTEHAVTLPVLAALYLYWVALTCGQTMDGKLSLYVLGDMLKQGGVIPFVNYETCPIVIVKSSKGKGGKSILLVVVGIAIAIPLVITALILLSAADESFNMLVGKVLNQISWRWLEYLAEFILGIPLAFYLFGQAYGNVKGDKQETMNKKSLSKFARALAKFPPLIGTTILACLNVIYIAFLGVQITHVVKGLPKDMSYSEFARQGFFQLCDVVVLNLVLVIAIGLLYKRKGRAKKLVRIQMALMSLLTIGITFTALAKMFMYIDVYGLTQLRIYTSVFMAFLVIVFLSIGVYQFKHFNIGMLICIAGLVILIAFNYAGVDRTIAKYNISRFEKGSLGMMDEKLMYSLGDGATPELYKFWKKTGDAKVAEVLEGLPADSGWCSWSVERELANRARDKYRKEK